MSEDIDNLYISRWSRPDYLASRALDESMRPEGPMVRVPVQVDIVIVGLRHTAALGSDKQRSCRSQIRR